MNKNGDQKRIGFHSIESIINNNPHKIKKLFLPYSREDSRIKNLIKIADDNGIKYEISKKLKQEPEAVITNENNLNFKDLKEFLDNQKDKKLMILVLDNIIDPRNLGACIRSAAVTGVDALIINKHHCAPLNDVAHSVSAGGAEYVQTFYVSNLVNCIKHLKESNINVFGLSEHAKNQHTDSDFVESTALIMGSEELGIRKKTEENCDFLIKLSNNKNFKSFNVSVATGIILSEVLRQRTC
jgi:23S rRNA (guanosine2251-2'-O)-methyltransferase